MKGDRKKKKRKKKKAMKMNRKGIRETLFEDNT
jgi:hypothetical protein